MRALAAAFFGFFDKTYVPDAAAELVQDGTNKPGIPAYLPNFPYLGTPYSGYDKPAA